MAGILDFLEGARDFSTRVGTSFIPGAETLPDDERRKAAAMGLLSLAGGLFEDPGAGFGKALLSGVRGLQGANYGTTNQLQQQAMMGLRNQQIQMQQAEMLRRQQQQQQQAQYLEGLASQLPPEQAALARLNPDEFVKGKIQALQPKLSERYVTVGNTLFDREAGKPIYTAPQQYAPSSDERLLSASGFLPGTAEYQAAARALLAQPKTYFDPANGQLVTVAPSIPGVNQTGQPSSGAGGVNVQQLAPRKLSATEINLLDETETAARQTNDAIAALERARNLGSRYSGVGAVTRAQIDANTVGTVKAQNTLEYNQLVSEQALSQMKAIFGANPTEGERKALLDLQAAASLPKEVADKAIDRAVELAKRRLQGLQGKQQSIKTGQYGSVATPVPAAPAPAPEIRQEPTSLPTAPAQPPKRSAPPPGFVVQE